MADVIDNRPVGNSITQNVEVRYEYFLVVVCLISSGCRTMPWPGTNSGMATREERVA